MNILFNLGQFLTLTVNNLKTTETHLKKLNF